MRNKKDSLAPENSESNVPFFARFLEGQDTQKDSFLTLKYPSDRDEIDQRFEFTTDHGNK